MKNVVLALALVAAAVATAAALTAAPMLAAALCAAIPLAVMASVYICGSERGFLSGSYLDRLLDERERMRDAAPNQGPQREKWWE